MAAHGTHLTLLLENFSISEKLLTYSNNSSIIVVINI